MREHLVELGSIGALCAHCFTPSRYWGATVGNNGDTVIVDCWALSFRSVKIETKSTVSDLIEVAIKFRRLSPW